MVLRTARDTGVGGRREERCLCARVVRVGRVGVGKGAGGIMERSERDGKGKQKGKERGIRS